MSKIPIPRNENILERSSNVLGQMWFRFLTEIAKRLNAAAGVTALSGGNETADGTYNQTKQQALIDKVNELTNSLK